MGFLVKKMFFFIFMGTAWLLLGELGSFVDAILPCATVPIPMVLSCELSGVGFFNHLL